MNTLPYFSHVLLADQLLIPQLPILRVSKSVREHDPNEGLLGLVFVIGTVILLGVGIAAVYYWLQRRPRRLHNPKRLFNDLCHAHQLTKGQRTQLCTLANKLKIAQPSLLFLDDTLWNFDQLSQGEYAATPSQIENLKKLNRTLFTTPKTKTKKSSLAQLVN